VDEDNRPVNDAQIVVSTNAGNFSGRTHADGVWDFFPSMLSPNVNGAVQVEIRAGQEQSQFSAYVGPYGDSQDMLVRLDEDLYQTPSTLDLSFLIDVTGSMGDELSYVNAEVVEIVRRIEEVTPGLQVRVSGTFYRDRGDDFVVRQIPFSDNVEGFAQTMERVDAAGGGDYAEDMNAGLMAALNNLEWSEGNAVRLLVLIADAPPQQYNQEQFTYVDAVRMASDRGIRILPVGASGIDREVEVLFRAMGTITSSPYVYLTDHSGVGNAHLEADTQTMRVEYFNELLSRLVISDLQGGGMHEQDSQYRPMASSNGNNGPQVIELDM
jgi:hypothetical protein